MLHILFALLLVLPASSALSGVITPEYSPPFFHIDTVATDSASVSGEVDTTTFTIVVTNKTAAPIFDVTVRFSSDRNDIHMPDDTVYLSSLSATETVALPDPLTRTVNIARKSALPEIRMHGIMEYVDVYGVLHEDEVLLIERF